MGDRKLAFGSASFKKAPTKDARPSNIIKIDEIKGGAVVYEARDPQKVNKGNRLEIAKTADGRGQLRLRQFPGQVDDEIQFRVWLDDIVKVDEPHTVKEKGIKMSSAWCFGFMGRIFQIEGKDFCGRKVRAAFVVQDPQGWIAAIMHPDWRARKG